MLLDIIYLNRNKKLETFSGVLDFSSSFNQGFVKYDQSTGKIALGLTDYHFILSVFVDGRGVVPSFLPALEKYFCRSEEMIPSRVPFTHYRNQPLVLNLGEFVLNEINIGGLSPLPVSVPDPLPVSLPNDDVLIISNGFLSGSNIIMNSRISAPSGSKYLDINNKIHVCVITGNGTTVANNFVNTAVSLHPTALTYDISGAASNNHSIYRIKDFYFFTVAKSTLNPVGILSMQVNFETGNYDLLSSPNTNGFGNQTGFTVQASNSARGFARTLADAVDLVSRERTRLAIP